MEIPDLKFHQIIFYIGITIFIFSVTEYLTLYNDFEDILINAVNGEYNTGDAEFDKEKIDKILELKANKIAIIGGVAGFSISLTLIGIFFWYKFEKKTRLKHCQSCGKTFNSMINYGTNKDTSKNQFFCSSCFKKGKFKNLNLTKDEVYKTMISELGVKDRLNKYLIKRYVNNLERWQKHHY